MIRRWFILSGLGSILMAAASWWVGSVPVDWHADPPGPISWFGLGAGLPRAAFYLGLLATTISWLGIGRVVLDRGVSVAQLRTYVTTSATPFLLAIPLGRDLWAYAGQGAVLRAGLDPYRIGPGDLGGPFAAEVSARWLHSPSPYGPAWLILSRLAVGSSASHPLVAVLLLRIPVFAGLLLWLWALPRLAERLGLRAELALWLGAASPLTLVLGVGGGHNDVLMVGLVAAGLAVVTDPGRHRLLLGGALLGLAVAVKSPAAVAVAFAVPLSLRGAPARIDDVIRRCVLVLIGAVVALAAMSVAGGLDLGWTRQVSANTSWVSWLSFPTALAMLGDVLTGTVKGATTLDDSMRALRAIGEVVAIATVALAWWLALRRRRALAYFVLALAAVVGLAPSVQPWYYCWPLTFVGLLTLRRNALAALAAVSVAFPVIIRPNGVGVEMRPIVVPILLVALAVCWLVLSSANDDRAQNPRAEVRADNRA